MPAAFEDDVQQVGFDLKDNISWDTQSLLIMKGDSHGACSLYVQTKQKTDLESHIHWRLLQNISM
ncbi:hypothetical protein BDR04DRAFT_364063 [Suillus decipiens]|nr:hypothetical protein BDR04DRAFT_364063 [Suillus decipiens]